MDFGDYNIRGTDNSPETKLATSYFVADSKIRSELIKIGN